MRVISLNIWGGRVGPPLLEFVQQHGHIDVFCFQEVYRKAMQQMSTEGPVYDLDVFSKIESRLPDHRGFFRPVVGEGYGICMFISKNLTLLEEGEITIHNNPDYQGRGPTHSRNLQWVKVRDKENHIYAILNVHGLWNGKGKSDSPERVAQSKKISEYIDSLHIPTILCGDFNLRPDTDSISLLEERLDNLITRFQIGSTRTSLYPKAEKFADYVFTSPNLSIKKFEVLPDEVSDHAPLLLETGIDSHSPPH